MNQFKLMIALGFCALASQISFAQWGLTGGLVAEANVSKAARTEDYRYGDYPTNWDDKRQVDFCGGARLGYAWGKFMLHTDIRYERNVHIIESVDNFIFEDASGNEVIGIAKIKERLTRISFPVLARFTVWGSEYGGLTLSAGPSFNVGLKGKRSSIVDTGLETFAFAPTETFSMGSSRFDEYKGFDAGLMLGLGGAIPLSGGGSGGDNEEGLLRLTFDLRKHWGFGDMYTTLRKTYLEQAQGISISGSKFMRGTYLSVGLEYVLPSGVRR